VRFVLDGKTYEADAIARLSLMDVLRFNREAERGDWGVSWADIEDLLSDLRGMSEVERRRHPGSVWLLALSVWRGFRDAGEMLSFEAALDRVPALDSARLRWLPDPEDHQPANPRKARLPKGSGRA
jgi:hypothetical protein